MAGGIPNLNLGTAAQYAAQTAGAEDILTELGIGTSAISSYLPIVGPALDALLQLVQGNPNAAIPAAILGPLSIIPGLLPGLQNLLGLQGLPSSAKTGSIAQQLSS